jgi:hypothetical protein
VQAVLVVHRMKPALLGGDPIVTEVASRYWSALFPLLAAFGRWTSLAFAYTAGFVLCRLLLLLAYHRFAWVVTRDRVTAALATFLLTGFGFYGFGFYLGGVPLLEEKLVPRAAALPFALLALAALVGRRRVQAMAWTCVAAALHPVTGAATVGVAAVYTLFELPSREAFSSLLGWTALAAGLAWIALATGALSHSGDATVDGAWAETVHRTVGPFVYVRQDMSWSLPLFPAALLLGAAALAAERTRTLLVLALRCSVAVALAVLLQLVAVDGLGSHVLLQANPSRASFALLACVGLALAQLLRRRIASPWPSDRAAGVVVFVCVMLRIDEIVTVPMALGCAALPTLRSLAAARLAVPRRERALGATLAVLLGVSVLSARDRMTSDLAAWKARGVPAWRPGHSFPPPFSGLGDLRELGVADRPAVAVQQWVRDHSQPAEAIFPPLSRPIGWQIWSERPCVWNASLGTFTHVSRAFAKRYREAMPGLRDLPGRPWRDVVAHARAVGASVVIVDRRVNPHRDGDPYPEYALGPYVVFRAR